MSTVSQKNRSIERPFCIVKAKRKLNFLFVYDFICLNPRYERGQGIALNKVQEGKLLCIKKPLLLNKGFLT